MDMRTDVRIIACMVALLFMVALAMVAAGWMLLAVFPFAGLCAVCQHIEKNREYYDREIDRICGKEELW